MPEVSEIAQALTTSLGQKWRSADLCSELLELLESALVDEPPTSDTDGGIFRLGYQPALDTLIRRLPTGMPSWRISKSGSVKRLGFRS